MPAKQETPYGVEGIACACATIRRASRAVTQLYDTWLREYGVEGPQFALLAMLERLGECNQAAMGQRLDLDKTTLSRNLKLLKQRGWIDVARGADARERRITLTAGGRRQLAAAKPAWRRAQSQLRSALNEHDWDSMLQVLDGVTHAARRARRPKP
ncbi:MAG TPA: MarR family winged helix-turn-helix transcriptional regulator [Vicinamibacterales bacterium]|jgi:DNA-binding MarR family transcriptional regulator